MALFFYFCQFQPLQLKKIVFLTLNFGFVEHLGPQGLNPHYYKRESLNLLSNVLQADCTDRDISYTDGFIFAWRRSMKNMAPGIDQVFTIINNVFASRSEFNCKISYPPLFKLILENTRSMPGAHIFHGPSPCKSESIGI